MLNQIIQEITKKKRPYYHQQGNTIKGINNQYWLIFKHRDADNLLTNIVGFLGLFGKHSNYRIIRIDLNSAHIYYYILKNENNLPNNTLLRTSKVEIIEKFLEVENIEKEDSLLVGTFLELEDKIRKRRKFNLPDKNDKYKQFISAYLERTKLYRRSTAYFESGVLKLYEEPLQQLVRNEGEIRLLMDWMGFTNTRDVKELKKLQEPDYRLPFVRRTLKQFLESLDDSSLTSTEILAELVRIDVLKIKMVKMDTERRAIYHKKTGILTDYLGNHIMHEGSDNFTKAAHTKNAESITFLYYSDNIDLEAIKDTIEQFDEEWEDSDYILDFSQEFLDQIIQERTKRIQQKQPIIESINPLQLIAGKVTTVTITGKNLENIRAIAFRDNKLITVTIIKQSKNKLVTEFEVLAEHPQQELNEIILTITQPQIHELKTPLEIIQKVVIPDFPEIEGFKEAVELILHRRHGQPEDFIYWLAQQKPHLLRVEDSELLVELVNDNILFEHQKSGAQHCYRIMQDFGVAVCADAVGLGKTRLAAAVAKLYQHHQEEQTRIAIIASKKLHSNWEKEMAELGFKKGNYELYNKNLMSRKSSNFVDDFNRFGGADLVIIDEAHEGIRNYNNRIHKTCLQIKQQDISNSRQRYYLLLTATPWNNRREDIYNILSPFLTRPEGFKDLGFPSELANWFINREIGVENFTDDTSIFRRVYKELFLQRTRKMLLEATPHLNLYGKRIAEWLPVVFEPETEQALEQIFTQFEDSLFIPFADPIRYLTGTVEQRSLLRNQRRMFLQRAESSMYALQRTIKNFSDRIILLQRRLEAVTIDAEGLKKFLLLHYEFISEEEFLGKDSKLELEDLGNEEDYWEEDEDEEETETDKEEKKQQLRTSIDLATDNLRDKPEETSRIYYRILEDCDNDLRQLQEIEQLLAEEFITDHKREQVTAKVRELVKLGHKVLLISTFSDTVLDYYHYMTKDTIISTKGIGMAIGGNKKYFTENKFTKISKHNITKKPDQKTGITRQELFRLFAPEANTKENKPSPEQEIGVLIGSETLSVGQNLQDADYLINIDLPWNPMILEQRIGRIDRPKQHPCDYLYIYYANSESQLLRQASRLNNLHKKLVGELAQEEKSIPVINYLDELGASIYGDTSFDDEVLPGYIDFIRSLVDARKLEQDNIQEKAYNKQETTKDLYTENEILQSEELKKLVQRLGNDYIPNSITLGKLNNQDSPQNLVALTIDYFDPNNKPLPDKKQVIYWNELTAEEDSYGRAIASGFQTPEYHQVVSAPIIIKRAEELYRKLVNLKVKYTEGLEIEESIENVNVTSERVSRIQKTIRVMENFPEGIDRKQVKSTLKKLNYYKQYKRIQKLLKQFTDGNNSKLTDDKFINQLVAETDKLSLLELEKTKATKLNFSLSALLILLN